jgi:hypothetical protein
LVQGPQSHPRENSPLKEANFFYTFRLATAAQMDRRDSSQANRPLVPPTRLAPCDVAASRTAALLPRHATRSTAHSLNTIPAIAGKEHTQNYFFSQRPAAQRVHPATHSQSCLSLVPLRGRSELNRVTRVGIETSGTFVKRVCTP